MSETFCQICRHPVPGHEPGCPVFTGEPQLGVLGSGRIEALVYPIMELVRANFRQGPASRERVFESLNALAIAAGVILQACDDPEAVTFFSNALNANIGDCRWHE
jgi:hypothetical protein